MKKHGLLPEQYVQGLYDKPTVAEIRLWENIGKSEIRLYCSTGHVKDFDFTLCALESLWRILSLHCHN